MELVDTQDLGSCAFWCVGSSPILGTIIWSFSNMFQETVQGIYLSIKIAPKASKNEIAGVENDALKIRIAAPPEKGAANAALVAFVASVLKIAKTNIIITQGETSRHKRLLIKSLSLQEIKRRLNLFLPDLSL